MRAESFNDSIEHLPGRKSKAHPAKHPAHHYAGCLRRQRGWRSAFGFGA